MNRMAYLLLASNWKSRSTEASNGNWANRQGKNLFSKNLELAAMPGAGPEVPISSKYADQNDRLPAHLPAINLNRPFFEQSGQPFSPDFRLNFEQFSQSGANDMARYASLVLLSFALIALALAEGSNPKAGSRPGHGEVKLWDVAERRCRATLQTETQNFGAKCTCVAISKNGRHVAAGTSDRAIWLWDAATGREIKHVHPEGRPLSQLPVQFTGVRFSADEQSINFVDHFSLGRWEWDRDQLVTVQQFPKSTGKLNPDLAEFDTSGQHLLYFRIESSPPHKPPFFLEIRNTATGEVESSLRLHEAVRYMALSGEGALIAGATQKGYNRGTKLEYSGTVRLLERASGKVKAETKGFGPIAFSPDGKTLVYFRERGRGLVFWDFPGETREAPSEFVSSLAFSPDGKHLAISEGQEGREQTIKLRDARTGAVEAELTGHAGRITDLAFSADGRILASAGSRQTGPETFIYPEHPNVPTRRWSNWRWLAAAGAGGMLLVALGGVCVWQLRRRSNSRAG